MAHTLQEVQHEIGSSGRFGEFFIGLGLLILLGGAILWLAGVLGWLPASHAGAAAKDDATVSGVLYIVEGVGFIIFGAVAILSGWDRHQDHEA